MKAKIKMRAVLLLAAALITVGAGCYYYYYIYDKNTALSASGTVETTKYEAAPRLSGYIRNLSLREGDAVAKGDLICEIERNDLSYANDSGWQAVEAAQAKLADLEKGARSQELVMAQAKIGEAESVLDKTAADHQRAQQLYAAGAVSRQALDDARQQHEAAQQSYTAAAANYELLQSGTREDQISQQRAEVRRLTQAAKVNQDMLKDVKIYSPADGVVISKNFENNELINAGQSVLTLSDMADCWIKVYIAEADLGRIHIGQAADLRVDSFPDEVFQAK